MTQAQEQRAALAEKHEMPTDGARMVPFRAVLRAEQVDWNGAQRYQLDGIASTTEQPYRMFDAFGEYDEVIDRAAFNETLSRDPDVAFLVNHKGVTMARSRPNGRGDVSAVNYGANPYTSIAARSAELLRDLDRLPAGAARAALERLQARRELQPTVIDLGARRSAEPAPSNGSGEVAPVLAPSPLLPPSETARGATFTIAGDRWYQVKPDAQIFARAGDSDELVSLGWVDDVEQLDAISGGPARVRTTPLPPSSLLPPVAGLSNDQRSDLGRSVRLVRTEWMIEDEDD
jgi:hypothetical protein